MDRVAGPRPVGGVIGGRKVWVFWSVFTDYSPGGQADDTFSAVHRKSVGSIVASCIVLENAVSSGYRGARGWEPHIYS